MDETHDIGHLASRICVSVAEPTVERCLAALDGLAFAEVRLDAIAGVGPEQAERIFSVPSRLIATFRPGAVDEGRRAKVLRAAVRGGARYVDLELDALGQVKDGVLAAARDTGCDVIVSHHDFTGTPDRQELERIVAACFASGADVAKVACAAWSGRDAARLLGLLDDPRRLVVLGMGEAGVITRVAGLMLGAELTFAARDAGSQTAPGQLTVHEIERRLESWMGSEAGWRERTPGSAGA